jgi:membrane-bound lytic murein transglycosylase A
VCNSRLRESSFPLEAVSAAVQSLRSPFLRPENIVHQTMRTMTASAARASSKINHMTTYSNCSQRCILVALASLLVSCASPPRDQPTAPDIKPPTAAEPALTAVPLQRARSRWVPVNFSELPGWEQDRSAELWPALLRSCERPAPEWLRLCGQARASSLLNVSDGSMRQWLQQNLQAYRVESLAGASEGLITGYYEPVIDAMRTAQGAFKFPLHSVPADLATRKPYWTRQQLDTLPVAQDSLRGKAIAFVADPLSVLTLQIQGSGRLNLTEPDGSKKRVRVAFAGHNDQPYKSVGRWLIEQGELRAEQASWPGIKAWTQRNPMRVNELMWANPRVVFFREEALLEVASASLPGLVPGPKGAQGVPLTAGRSIAVDAQSIPYGTPVWLSTTEPLSNTPLRRLVMAQDTGTAIVGAVRADYFWGAGDEAEAQAGRMKQALLMWALWPQSQPKP